MKKKLVGFFKNNVAFFAAFPALFATYLFWWLSFFPGTMSPDSITHWSESKTMLLSNASPYLYSLIMAGLIRVWETPAVMGLLQIIVLVSTVSLFINYAYKKGINPKLLAAVVFLFMAHPVFGIYNVTIWKDVLYSYLVLAVLLLTVVILTSPELLKKYRYFLVAAFGALIALIPLLRFNGVVFFVFIPVALVFLGVLEKKKLMFLVAIQIGVYLFFSVILSNLLNVASAPLMKEGIYVKLAGAIYHLENPNLNEEQSKILTTIMKEEDWKKYYQCISVDNMFYVGLPKNRSISYSQQIDPDPKLVSDWHKAVITASLRNPKALIYDKACMASYLLGAKDILYKYEGSIYLADKDGPIKYQSLFPLGKRALYKYLVQLSAGTADGYGSGNIFSKAINFAFWSALVPLLAFLFYGYLALRQNLRFLGVYVLLMLLNIVAVVALVPAASFRYIYVLFVAAPFLPIVYALEKGKPKKADK